MRDIKPNDERLPNLAEKSKEAEDVCCSKFNKMAHRLEKKLAVYKVCNETLLKK
jgi:hypothetical protein